MPIESDDGGITLDLSKLGSDTSLDLMTETEIEPPPPPITATNLDAHVRKIINAKVDGDQAEYKKLCRDFKSILERTRAELGRTVRGE